MDSNKNGSEIITNDGLYDGRQWPILSNGALLSLERAGLRKDLRTMWS